VIPAYNEEAVIPEFYRRVRKVTEQLPFDFQLIFVDDGSTDNTEGIVSQLYIEDKSIELITLSRNFGKEIAMTAGLDHAAGDAVIIIDADLQDPPELITSLIERWRSGYDVVYAKRLSRDGETFFKKLTARLFYKVAGLVQSCGDSPRRW
jgi:polyisoprenyl-phosphate glycosyltransferase